MPRPGWGYPPGWSFRYPCAPPRPWPSTRSHGCPGGSAPHGRRGVAEMLITATWLRLDGRRRWRSLAVLALLIALATATILTSIAGARRGQTAFDRLWARTLPATATVLPNQPGFDWAKVAALPEVAALTKFPVVFGFEAQGFTAASTGFPLADDQMTRTIERPVMVAGTAVQPAPRRQVIVTPKFAATSGKHVGDTLILELASVQQANQGYDGTTGPPLGPRIRARIVGVGRTPWGLDADTPGVTRRHPHHARPVHPVPRQHAGHERAGLHQRAGPAQRRPGRDSGFPRRPGPGDRAVRHRRLGQPAANRRSHAQGVRLRGRLPAGLRARGAGRGPVPDRPVRRPVHLRHRGGSPGAAGRGHDPPAGHRGRLGRARSWPGWPAARWAWPAPSWLRDGCRSAWRRSPSRIRGSAWTGWSWAPDGSSSRCWCWPARRLPRRPR